MRRREFITLLGGAAAWPIPMRAQQPERMRSIGVLVGVAEDDANMIARLTALRQGLARRGWSEGRNIRIDYRYAPAGARVQALANELVALQPDVILAHTVTVAAALQKESRTIPIVFVSLSDPIGSGFIDSLARPGGNLTGLTTFEPSIAGKWLSMLKEVTPESNAPPLWPIPKLGAMIFTCVRPKLRPPRLPSCLCHVPSRTSPKSRV